MIVTELLPDNFPPAEAWAEFVAMRKKLKKPMTPYAEKLMLRRLRALVVDGQDAEAVLNQSIRMAWQDVYAVKDEQPVQRPAFQRPAQISVAEQNARNAVEARRMLGFNDLDDEGRIH